MRSLFLCPSRRECSLGAHGLLRFRTNDVLLGTSGVGVWVSVVSYSPGMLIYFFLLYRIPEVVFHPRNPIVAWIVPRPLGVSSGRGFEFGNLTLFVYFFHT